MIGIFGALILVAFFFLMIFCYYQDRKKEAGTLKRAKVTVLLTLVLIIGIIVGCLANDIKSFIIGKGSLLFSTGTLLRNIAVALFAISIWKSQHRTNRTIEFLNTLDVGEKELIALRLLVQLKDIAGFDELQGKVNIEFLQSLKKSVGRIRLIERIRNITIVLFTIGVLIEAAYVISQWLF